jgi:hypothetical protein
VFAEDSRKNTQGSGTNLSILAPKVTKGDLFDPDISGTWRMDEQAQQPPKSRLRWIGGVACCFLVVALAGTPVVLVHTSARNLLLSTAIHSETLQASAESADGGWFRPLEFHNLQLVDADGQVTCSIGRLQTSKGLLTFLLDGDAPLHVSLHDVLLKVDLDDDGSWPKCGRQHSSNSTLHYSIHGGAFQLNAPWRPLPIVDLADLNLNGRIGPDAAGRRQLFVEPCSLLDQTQIADSHASQNLALIAPILSQTTRIDGAASVSLDAITVPLDGPEPANPFPLRGRAIFHKLDASLRSEFLAQLKMLLPSTEAAIPSRIEVLEDLAVSFEVTRTGIQHSGMVVLLPELARNLRITTSGSIGLDESLQLDLEVQLPSLAQETTAKSDGSQPRSPAFAALLAGLASQPLRIRVTGTVSQPQFALPDGVTLASELLRRLTPAEISDNPDTDEPPSVPGAVFGLIRSISNSDANSRSQQLPGSILNMIRAAEKSAKERRKRREKKMEP